MKNRILLFASAFVMVIVMSCGNKGGKSGLLVPKDAAMVVHINTASLSSKLSWEEIKQTNWFNKMNEEVKDTILKRILDNPDYSGVDIKAGFTFFIKQQGSGGYASLQGGIKDVTAFETMLQQAKPTSANIEKSGDLSFIKMDDEALLSWTKSKFIILGNAPLNQVNPMMDRNGNYGKTRFESDSLLIFSKEIYGLKGSDLLDSDAKFADLIKSNGDVHLWISAENFYKGMAGGVMNMLKLSTLMHDNISTATLNFDNGKITMEGKQYYGKELAAIISKYPPKEVSTDVINRLPSGEVIAAGSLSYPIEGLMEIVKAIGADGLANMFLGKQGIGVDDISKAFTGDMAFAISNIQKKTDTVTFDDGEGNKRSYPTTKTSPDFVVGIGVKEKSSFDKLYSVLMGTMNDETPKGITIKNESNWFIVSNSEEGAGSFLKGGNTPAYAEKIKGHAMGFYVNIQKLVTSFKDEVKEDSIGKAAYDLTLATWQDGVAYGDYKSGLATYKMEVNMVDKSTNSLKQINTFTDKMYQIQELRRRAMYDYDMHDYPVVDSVKVVAPKK